jgi:ABC-type dipeptide/oligopeptide/nickel transport system ATPase component
MQSTVNPFSTRFWGPGKFSFVFDDGISNDRISKSVTTIETLFQNILRNRLMQIIGPHGSGKSTLLQSIAEFGKQQKFSIRFAFLNKEQRHIPDDFLAALTDNSGNKLFLLDGYEQLPFHKRCFLRSIFSRSRYRNSGNHLIWTTHYPAWFVPVLYRAVPRFECFKQLAEELLKEQNMKIDEVRLQEVFTASKGNFRDAFMQLYDDAEIL